MKEKDEIISQFKKYCEQLDVDSAFFEIKYSDGGSRSTGHIVHGNNKEGKFLPRDIRKKIKAWQKETLLNPELRFNILSLSYDKKSESVNVQYSWDDEYVEQNIVDRERLFPQWINERMMSIIYEHEFPNGPTAKDVDGDPLYESTWDSGTFTFLISDSKDVEVIVELKKDGKSRKMDLTLPEYFTKAMIEHYQITHGELKHKWQPWNKMVIKSPHNDLPYGHFEKHVFYNFEE